MFNVELVHTAPSPLDMYSDCMVFASAALFHTSELKLRAREKEPNNVSLLPALRCMVAELAW